MQFETINTDAMDRALRLANGDEGAEIIHKLYQAIDAAQAAAHAEGYGKGFADAGQVPSDEEDIHREGFEQGYAAGYDEGFNAGLGDEDRFYDVSDFEHEDDYDDQDEDLSFAEVRAAVQGDSGDACECDLCRWKAGHDEWLTAEDFREGR
jgi:hypothetical protein